MCRWMFLAWVLTWVACDGPGGARVSQDPTAQSYTSTLPPLVNAGADRMVLTGSNVCLDGTSSYHPLGIPLYFTWTQTSGDSVYLSDPASRTPCFVAPVTPQTLVFQLSANDSTWLTDDTMRVIVVAPGGGPANANGMTVLLQPPTVRAGPDRFLQGGQALTPRASDVSAADPDTEISWEAVTARAVPGAAGTSILANATIFRLSGNANNLNALPDYLLLWPYDPSLGQRGAPIARLGAPTLATVGETIALDARDSSNAAGDALRWRWVQSCGEDALLTTDLGNVAQTQITLNQRPQTVCVRVTVRDSILESAPVDVRVTVAPPDGVVVLPPAPPPPFAVHAGNSVVVSADPDQLAPPQTTYVWSQTAGSAVPVLEGAGNPLLAFTAPDVLGVLAFSVTAANANVLSSPAMALINVEAGSTNTAPVVHLCVDGNTPVAGSTVTLYANAADPEQDALNPAVTWSAAPSGSVAITPIPTGARPAACPLPQTLTGAPAQPFAASLTAPPSGTEVTLSVAICDNLGACGMSQLTIRSQ